MTKRLPEPRKAGKYFGWTMVNQTFDNGTWLEAEEFAYPNGGFTRRSYATCEDGVKRVVQCSISDTFFSIPAKVRIDGKTTKGFLTMDVVDGDRVGIKFVIPGPDAKKSG